MWSLLQWFIVRVAAARWIFKLIGGFAFLVPLLVLLKTIGLPILGILSIVALPVLFMLFIFGLPIFLVLLVGGGLMTFLFFALTLGLIAVKVALFVVLPIWVVWKLCTWIFRRGRKGDEPSTATDL
jgi:hypothetical protein